MKRVNRAECRGRGRGRHLENGNCPCSYYIHSYIYVIRYLDKLHIDLNLIHKLHICLPSEYAHDHLTRVLGKIFFKGGRGCFLARGKNGDKMEEMS